MKTEELSKPASGDIQSWNEIQKDFYNKRDHKRMWHAPRSLFVRNVIERFVAFTGIPKDAKILEIGCGAGRYTIPLIEMGYHVTGVDISERMLKKCEEDLNAVNVPSSRYRLICSDIDAMRNDFRGQFNVVVGFNVLHHLFDLNKCFETLSVLVKDGGWLAFNEPNARNPMHTIDSLLDRACKAEENKSNSIPQKVQQAMIDNRLRQVDFFLFGFFPPFVIDAMPVTLKWEKHIEKTRGLKNILPYFMIKGKK